MSDDILKAVAKSSLAHRVQIRAFPSPGAGADFSTQVGNGEVWRVIGFTATLTTSAAAANRVPAVRITDQTNVGGIASLSLAITATSVVTVSWGLYASTSATVVTGGSTTVALPEWTIPAGYLFQTVTGNIQAGDQWSAITAMIELLDEPPYRVPLVGTELDDEYDALRAQGMS